MECEAVLHQLLVQDDVLEDIVTAHRTKSKNVSPREGGAATWRVNLTHVASWEAFISTARATLGPAPRKRLPAPSSRTMRYTPSKLKPEIKRQLSAVPRDLARHPDSASYQCL